MTLPTRIQRKRTPCFRLPEGTTCCTRPGPYGNPFRVGNRSPGNHSILMDAEHALEHFEVWLECKDEAAPGGLMEWLRPLYGAKYLACWCDLDAPCHVDVILRKMAECSGETEPAKPNESKGPDDV